MKRGARLRQRLLGVGFIVVIVGSIGLTIAIFDKQFTSVVMVSLKTDRIGNQLLPNSDVKVRGLVVGEVRDISSDGSGATLALAINPDMVDLVPSNVSARLLPKTLFGEKYVSLVLPTDDAARPLRAGDTITQDRSAAGIEVGKVLDDLLPLLQAVKPQDLSATLGALSQALDGRGAQLGTNLVRLNDYVGQLNTELPNLKADISGLADFGNTYTVAAPDLIQALDDLTTTSRTVVEQRTNIDSLYSSLIGASGDLTGFLQANASNLIRLSADSTQTLQLLAQYSPEYGCLLNGLTNTIPRVNTALGVGTSTPGLRISLEVVNGRGKYLPNRDEPNFTDTRGPVCYPIVPPDQGNFQLPPTPFKDGSVAPEQRAPGQASVLPGSGDALGITGSPAEAGALATIFSQTTGTAVQDVPGWSALVAAPALRGNEVTVK
jgi:phospholipid/cholesterol/gamma-HCH transport system substrate-binding protein